MFVKIGGGTDPSVDNYDRVDFLTSQMPAGAGYKTYVHYGQLAAQEKEAFKRFDYESKSENQKHYGQDYAPDYDLSKVDVPMAMLSGSIDVLADPADVKWTHEQLKHTIVFFHEYYMDHQSFAIAKNMAWFEVDTMAVINHYNGRCSEETQNSRFALGNEKCKKTLMRKKSAKKSSSHHKKS
jgi:hypothetical protein